MTDPAPPSSPLPPGEDDDLIEATDNGRRPADAALEQPPQDPTWPPA